MMSSSELAEMRLDLDAFASEVSVTEPFDDITDGTFGESGHEVSVRTYRPGGTDDAVLVWFHGGGFVSGTLAAIDPTCRSLARRLGSTVMSVDYRLAPEHPFPAAIEDGLRVVAALAGTRRLAVGGDSAGGGLAAAVARQTAVPLRALVLLCPWLDLTLASPSVQVLGQAEGLTEAGLRDYAAMYLGDAAPTDPRASPLLGDLTGLPPTVIVTAGNDPLRDEGELYGQKLVTAGGVAHVRRWEAMPHGFVGMTAGLAEAEQALQWTTDQLRELLDR